MQEAACNAWEVKLFAENADRLDLDVWKQEETQCGPVSSRWTWKLSGDLWHQVVFKANTIENDLGDLGKVEEEQHDLHSEARKKADAEGTIISKKY